MPGHEKAIDGHDDAMSSTPWLLPSLTSIAEEPERKRLRLGRIRVVLFDFDGTLTVREDTRLRCLSRAAQKR